MSSCSSEFQPVKIIKLGHSSLFIILVVPFTKRLLLLVKYLLVRGFCSNLCKKLQFLMLGVTVMVFDHL